MRLFHLSWRSEDRSVLFLETSAQLRAVRRIVSVPGGRVLWFCIVDNHVHVVFEPVGTGRQYTRNLLAAFRGIRSDLKMGPPHLRPVDGQYHLENLVEYITRNPEKHGLGGKYAAAVGNSIADIAGARVLPSFDAVAWQPHLQRWNVGHWLRRAGVPCDGVGEATLDEVRALGAFGLERAGAALIGRESLRSHEPIVRSARRAVVTQALAAGIPSSEVVAALGIARTTIYKLAAHPDANALSDALARRVWFDALIDRTQPLPRANGA